MATSVPAGQESAIQIELASRPAALRSYRAELPLELLDEEGNTLDWLIGFTFDTLDAVHLDLRIVGNAIANDTV